MNRVAIFLLTQLTNIIAEKYIVKTSGVKEDAKIKTKRTMGHDYSMRVEDNDTYYYHYSYNDIGNNIIK